MLIECRNVNKAFGGVVALDAITLDLCGPAIIGIIGPNGAGKTTLINVLTGLVSPDFGKVFLDGCEVTKMSAQMIARRGVSRTFQELRLILQVSALDNVLVAGQSYSDSGLIPSLLSFRGRSQSKAVAGAQAFLEFVGLGAHAEALAGELSYGQQKLLSIGCALATGAPTLFLDEPVAGLHPETSARVLGVLRELRAQGKLVVMVEHDINAIREVSDRLVVMGEGRVLADGVAHDVLKRPEIMDAYVA